MSCSCLELISSKVDVVYSVLSTRHEQGSNPAEKQSKILAQAQDHTEAASSWLKACELMSGHAVWYRLYFSSSLLLVMKRRACLF